MSCWWTDHYYFFFSSRRRHTRWTGDWSSDVCSSDLYCPGPWLKKGANELVILELNGAQKHSLAGLIEPILNELNPEATGRSEERRVGKECRCRCSLDQ